MHALLDELNPFAIVISLDFLAKANLFSFSFTDKQLENLLP